MDGRLCIGASDFVRTHAGWIHTGLTPLVGGDHSLLEREADACAVDEEVVLKGYRWRRTTIIFQDRSEEVRLLIVGSLEEGGKNLLVTIFGVPQSNTLGFSRVCKSQYIFIQWDFLCAYAQ